MKKYILAISAVCFSLFSLAQELNCSDGIDNDNDGLIDYADPDCKYIRINLPYDTCPVCTTPTCSIITSQDTLVRGSSFIFASNGNTTFQSGEHWFFTPPTGVIPSSGNGMNTGSVTFNDTGIYNITFMHQNINFFPYGCAPADSTSCDHDFWVCDTIDSLSITGNFNPIYNATESYATTVYPATTTDPIVYNWACTGCVISSGQGTSNINVLWNTYANHTLDVTVSNTCYNSSKNISKNILVCDTLTSVSITGDNAPIYNGISTYVANPIPIEALNTESQPVSYLWSCTGCVINAGQNTASADVLWNTHADQSINVTVGNSCYSSSKKDTFDVVVCDTITNVTVTGDFSPLPGDTRVYSVATSPAGALNTESQPVNYVWTCTGCTINSGQGTTSANITWTGTGIQTVSATVSNNCNSSSVTRTENVQLCIPMTSVSVSGNNSVTVNNSASYNVTYSPGTSDGPFTYSWSCNGCSFTSGTTGSSVTVNWTSVGSRSITANVTTSCSGTLSNTRGVSVAAPPCSTPSCSISGPSSLKPGESGTFTGSGSNIDSYSWNIGGSGSSASTSWATVGAKTVSLSVSNSSSPSGCAGTQTSTCNKGVTVTACDALTSVSISGSTEVIRYQTFVVTGSITVGTYTATTAPSGATTPYSYNWSVDGGTILSGAGTNVITVRWTSTGTKTVSVVADNACTNPNVTDNFSVTVRDRILCDAVSVSLTSSGSYNSANCAYNAPANVTVNFNDALGNVDTYLNLVFLGPFDYTSTSTCPDLTAGSSGSLNNTQGGSAGPWTFSNLPEGRYQVSMSVENSTIPSGCEVPRGLIPVVQFRVK